jgi:uncharacterized protein YabE (DUF348 family)
MYKKLLGNRLVLKIVAPLLVALLLIVSFMTAQALINKKSFSVVIEGTTTQYTSTASTIGEALDEAFITVNEKDKVSPGIDTKGRCHR